MLWLSDDHKSGIFLSPTRGYVKYDAVSDTFSETCEDDPVLKDRMEAAEPEIHTIFGDAYLVLELIRKTGLNSVIRKAFSGEKEKERLYCHLLHTILKDGSKIHCEDFLSRSFLSYVDSTPLPNDIGGIELNAICCHGTGGATNQARLVLVLDEKTGLPVWYDIIPGNVLDLSTIKPVIEDVATSLDIEIDSVVLDAGYAVKDIFTAFNEDKGKDIIIRMPEKRGYHYKELYNDVKAELGHGKYLFPFNGHTYFGQKKETEIFGVKLWAYIYLDKQNADSKFLAKSINEDYWKRFQTLKDYEKDWETVKGGFFILLSSYDKDPEEILRLYFGRTEIEQVFKAGKEYLDLLPLNKWTLQTVRGKILNDMISTIILLQLRKELKHSPLAMSQVFGKCSSLMCRKNKDELITESPNKQVKQCYSDAGFEVPSRLKHSAYRREFLGD